MKKTLFLVMGLSLALSACMPAFLQSNANPTPQVDLNATAAVLVTASLVGSLPSPTIEPSNTPVVTTATSADTQVPPVTPSETQTLTTTIGLSETPTLTSTGNLPTPTPSATLNPSLNATPSTTPHPQHFGTMPPFLPSGNITLINRSKAQAYISLQCTTKEGFVTIIEYPVRGPVNVKAPAGKYVFVAWVGGRKMVGNFALDKDGELTIKLYKDKVVVGK